MSDDGPSPLFASFTAIRPDDLAVLTFRLDNLVVARDAGAPRLVRADPSSDAFVTVEVAPQAFGEEAFSEQVEGGGSGPEPDPGERRAPPRPGGVAVRMARRSRLVFAVPGGEEDIAWSLQGLLEACQHLPVSIAAFGAVPERLHTALEVPYGVVLAPGPGARWQHSAAPAGSGGRVELWHTRLGGEAAPVVRAVALGLDTIRPDEGHSDFETTLSAQAVKDLVAYGNTEALANFAPERLMLSSLGAFFEADVEFDRSRLPEPVQTDTELSAWAHRSTMGRDHYVRTVEEGHLFPFGHKAAKITISQRKFERADDDSPVAAYLRQRFYVVVRQRELGFQGDLALPFRSVAVQTAVTPDLLAPAESAIAGQGDKAFWPMVAPGHDAVFELVAEDRNGARVAFASPLAFVSTAVDRGALAAWIHDESADGFLSKTEAAVRRRERDLGGQPVAFAEGRSDRTDSDSTFETAVVELGAKARPTAAGNEPPFSPVLLRAVAQLPAVRALTGLAGDQAAVSFSYHRDYVDNNDHRLDVFAQVLTDDAGMPLAPTVGFANPEQGGGLVAPRLTPTALSRTFGPVGGKLTDVDAGTFRPADVFGELPKLLGTLKLTDLLKESIGFASLDEALPANPGAPRLPRLANEGPGVSRLRWQTGKDDLAVRGDAVPVFAWRESSLLSVDVVRRPPGGPEESAVASKLEGFSVQLPTRANALVEVPFDLLEFTARSGKKPDVSVKVGDVRFLGSLAFVNALAKLIPPAGFEDPPALEVTAGGIRAGYTLAIPTLAFGVFNLQHLALSAGFHLPLVSDGSPASLASLGVAFSERENPCLLTVSSFGGAAFLALDVGLGGLNILEGSLEFGGAVAMSIGVASGGVTVMAGVYYAWQPGMDALSAFLRCNGVLEVLGIVSISAAFYLALQWVNARLAGTATLVVKVKVLFVSKSVSLTVTREFAGSPAPSFAQAVSKDEWKAYLAAFAPEGTGG